MRDIFENQTEALRNARNAAAQDVLSMSPQASLDTPVLPPGFVTGGLDYHDLNLVQHFVFYAWELYS